VIGVFLSFISPPSSLADDQRTRIVACFPFYSSETMLFSYVLPPTHRLFSMEKRDYLPLPRFCLFASPHLRTRPIPLFPRPTRLDHTRLRGFLFSLPPLVSRKLTTYRVHHSPRRCNLSVVPVLGSVPLFSGRGSVSAAPLFPVYSARVPPYVPSLPLLLFPIQARTR